MPYTEAQAAAQQVQHLTHAIQRLTRENHKHLETLKVVAQDANRMRDALAQARSDVLHARDCTRNREAELQSLARAHAVQSQQWIDCDKRRRAAEGALQALSASRLSWGTLALGWLLGAATVLVWAFW